DTRLGRLGIGPEQEHERHVEGIDEDRRACLVSHPVEHLGVLGRHPGDDTVDQWLEQEDGCNEGEQVGGATAPRPYPRRSFTDSPHGGDTDRLAPRALLCAGTTSRGNRERAEPRRRRLHPFFSLPGYSAATAASDRSAALSPTRCATPRP